MALFEKLNSLAQSFNVMNSSAGFFLHADVPPPLDHAGHPHPPGVGQRDRRLELQGADRRCRGSAAERGLR